MHNETEKMTLDILKACGALLEGHFELRSGLHSNRFFQCANIQQYPRQIARLSQVLGNEVTACLERNGVTADSVISPALGGIVVGHELARELDLRSIFVEKADGILVLRRHPIRQGERFIIAEDVITRGGRVQETIDIVEAAGGHVVAIAVLVDRSGGKAVFKYPLVSLLGMEPVVYKPENCPLCEQQIPLVHPGS